MESPEIQKRNSLPGSRTQLSTDPSNDRVVFYRYTSREAWYREAFDIFILGGDVAAMSWSNSTHVSRDNISRASGCYAIVVFGAVHTRKLCHKGLHTQVTPVSVICPPPRPPNPPYSSIPSPFLCPPCVPLMMFSPKARLIPLPHPHRLPPSSHQAPHRMTRR